MQAARHKLRGVGLVGIATYLHYMNMNASKLAGVILFMWLIQACANPKAEAVKAVAAQVIVVHDEAMAKMNSASLLARALGGLKDSLIKAKQETLAVDSAITLLTSAEASMNGWMEAYEPEFEKQLAVDSAAAYADRELEKVSDTNRALDQAVAQSSAVLTRYGRALPKASAAAHEGGHGDHH
jgi:hypothetical protein